MLKVFIEGYAVPVSRVQLETGAGPLQAQIVIPPGDNRRRILPGSRVLCYVKEGTEWYQWFQGVTTNMPETALGFDENPVVLHVLGDIGLLQSVLMSYLSLGQVDITNQTFKSQSFAGRANLFSAGIGPLLFPFAQAIANQKIGFGDRLVGVIQAMLSMDPQGWEDLRRLQYLNRLAIEMADDIASGLDTRVVMQSISYTLGSIQQEAFTALDILNTILKLSLHELNSVAPLRYSGDNELRFPVRHRNYMPKGVGIEDIASFSQKELVDKFCYREPTKDVFIDHFIKPVDRFRTCPAANVITKGMYSNAYVTDTSFTRNIIKIPLMVIDKPVMVTEELMPDVLKKVHMATSSAANKASNSASLGAVSSVMAERITGFRTNEEKVRNGTRPLYSAMDPRVNSMLSSMYKMETEEGKKDCVYQKSYAEAMMRHEYEKANGSSILIQNATFNLAPICGFTAKVEDFNGKWYTGKLVKKVDIIDLSASHASSTYSLTQCKADDALDYNGPVTVSPSTSLPEFQKYGSARASATSPLFMDYEYTAELLIDALSPHDTKSMPYADYGSSLAINHLMEVDHEELAPESRFSRATGGFLSLTDNGKLPSMKQRTLASLVHSEGFYNDFDLLTEAAAQIIERNDTDLTDFLPYLNASKSEAISIIDSKGGNIFSVFLKSIGYEVFEKAAAHAAFQDVYVVKNDWVTSIDYSSVDIGESQRAVQEAAKAENQRIDGVNSEIKKMFGTYNPNFPLYLGNPCPLRIEVLLWFLSRISEGYVQNFLETGVGNFTEEGIQRPLSDRQVIALRRSIAKKASHE